MNKHGRIIEIRGFKGLVTAIFVLCCIITGFTVFPGFIAMNVWNFIAKNVTDMPTMQLLHGVMLWAIIFLIWYAFSGKHFALHFGCNSSDEKLKEIVEQIRRENEENSENKDD